MKRFEELDSLRGLAALSVLISHYFLMLNIGELTSTIARSPLRLFMAAGEAVIFFFLLRGFVLALPLLNGKKLTVSYYRDFTVKRITRIYLPYLVAILLTIVCYFMFFKGINNPQVSEWGNGLWKIGRDFGDIINHIIFIGDYPHNFNVVIWSLIHELRISLIFPFVVILIAKAKLKTSFFLLTVGWILSIFIYLVLGEKYVDYIETFFYLQIFIIGALLAKYKDVLITKVKQFSIKSIILTLVVALVLYVFVKPTFILKRFFELDMFIRDVVDIIFIVSGASIIIILALSNKILSTLLLIKPLNFIGKISYSLYMYHLPVVLTFTHAFNGKLSIWWILIISVITTLIISTLSYYFIELKCIDLGKKIVKSLNKKEVNVEVRKVNI